MTPERWQQIEQLFNSALKLPLTERPSFLDDACRDDLLLRNEVESLLAADETAHNLSEAIPAEVAAKMFGDRESAGLVGITIDRYLVLSSIGAGGMGEVYLAEDTTLRRKVALKVLPHFYTSDPERVQRFELEARAASALNHPHIVTIHEIGHWRNTQFIVTEFIDGHTLRERMQKGRVGVDELIEIALQSASALAAAHNAGIVHRDIKPANIMIRSDGYVKVLDFGLAKLTSNSAPDTREARTDPGRVMGTIHYMSPEQALGEQVDQRTDIFSLGVVLYELASGKLPFAGNSDAAVYNEILNKTPETLDHHPARLPAELSRIIQRALEKDRGRRYQTATELHSDLKRLQNDSNLKYVPAVKSSKHSIPLKPLIAV
jgi:serine/threonine protein kinase